MKAVSRHRPLLAVLFVMVLAAPAVAQTTSDIPAGNVTVVVPAGGGDAMVSTSISSGSVFNLSSFVAAARRWLLANPTSSVAQPVTLRARVSNFAGARSVVTRGARVAWR
jgi:hypothetical protein